MTLLKTLAMTTMLSFGLTCCNAQLTQTPLTKLDIPVLDSATTKILTITKVKKPWYAWRGIVVGKMQESIPEYQAVKGLNQKFYSFTENHEKFGGLYFWETQQAANNWFNQAWFDGTVKKYGEKGIVEYYKVRSIKTVARVGSEAKDLYANVSYENEVKRMGEEPATGVVMSIALTDEKNQDCILTIWQNKKQSEAYYKNKDIKIESFDLPFFIINKQ